MKANLNSTLLQVFDFRLNLSIFRYSGVLGSDAIFEFWKDIKYH